MLGPSYFDRALVVSYVSQMSYELSGLIIGLMASCQKWRIILENKVIQKLMLSKMSITKMCS